MLRQLFVSPIRLLVPLAGVSALLLVACGSSAASPEATDGTALVWEAWGQVEDNYAGFADLDTESVTAGAVNRILEFSGAQPYPFLTEIGRMRGQVPPEVPSQLGDVWRALSLYLRDESGADQLLLAEAAVGGMMDGLGDASAVFLTAEQYPQARENLEASMEGSYLGIGARVVNQEGLILLFPFSGSPAEKGEVEAGDVLIAVEGRSTAGQSVREVVDQVSGPEGTKVALRVLRQSEPEPVDLEVFRGTVEVPSVASQLTPGGIAYVRISRLRSNTGEQLLTALEDLKRFDMLALMLDLRSNPGGSVAAANDVAAQFLPPGTLFRYVVDRDGRRTEETISDDVQRIELGDLPMVVLVNDQTVGEAEAVAGVLQDSGRAVILGTETFGDGSNYGFVDLSNGSAMYLPTSRWLTPSGNQLGPKGIEPDMVVEFQTEAGGIGGESQFNRAYEYLNGLLPLFR